MKMKFLALCIQIAYGNPERTPIYKAAWCGRKARNDL